MSDVETAEVTPEGVLARIKSNDGRVEGANIAAIAEQLGLGGRVSNNRLRKILGKLVCEKKLFCLRNRQFTEGCDPRGMAPVHDLVYVLR